MKDTETLVQCQAAIALGRLGDLSDLESLLLLHLTTFCRERLPRFLQRTGGGNEPRVPCPVLLGGAGEVHKRGFAVLPKKGHWEKSMKRTFGRNQARNLGGSGASAARRADPGLRAASAAARPQQRIHPARRPHPGDRSPGAHGEPNVRRLGLPELWNLHVRVAGGGRRRLRRQWRAGPGLSEYEHLSNKRRLLRRSGRGHLYRLGMPQL